MVGPVPPARLLILDRKNGKTDILMSDVALKEKIRKFGSLFLENALRIKFMTENDFETLSFLAVDRYLRTSANPAIQQDFEAEFYHKLSSVIDGENHANGSDALPRDGACSLDYHSLCSEENTVESDLLRGSDISSLRSRSSGHLYQTIRNYFSVHGAHPQTLASKKTCLKNGLEDTPQEVSRYNLQPSPLPRHPDRHHRHYGLDNLVLLGSPCSLQKHPSSALDNHSTAHNPPCPVQSLNAPAELAPRFCRASSHNHPPHPACAAASPPCRPPANRPRRRRPRRRRRRRAPLRGSPPPRRSSRAPSSCTRDTGLAPPPRPLLDTAAGRAAG
jgi:hypothetical protein